MNRFLYILVLSIILPAALPAQTVNYSSYSREDSRDINFEVIGKINSNILVYKNIRWKHKINIYDNEMKDKETINLDFIPDKTFNIDFITYPDFFYMIYQFQKRNILHCMAVKMDGNGKKMGEPVELDTTQISVLADNKIYATINSEDKQKIMIFKIQRKYDKFNMVTLLFDKDLNLLKKSRQVREYNERKDNYSNFLLGNDGNFIFTLDKQLNIRDYSNGLTLVSKAAWDDSLAFHHIDLGSTYIDEVKLKIDNLNNRYIINTFYYKKNRGSIEGMFTYVWDIGKRKEHAFAFAPLYDSLRDEAKTDGLLRFAFDEFFIRQVVVKKDGGFILTAEDFTTQTRGSNNPWNRWDYLNNPYSLSSNSYYSYSPYNYYRPRNSFYNQSTRYYYQNILVMSMNKNGQLEWSKVIHKEQFDDDDDNFLSFSTLNSGGEIHFLFNMDKKNQIISDQSITADGTLKRNATLKSEEKGYEFMPRHSKQVGARQIIVPCAYRGYICFAKIDF
ncbi:MAG TPA: hypothetical protein VK489_03600 [Ferruginibacter sp.]|nr:hypothetical protein [Ferruginibacter sp.]